MPVDISLPDAAATLRVGEALAGGVAAGRVLHLRGELGTGKTTVVRGLLRVLGFTGRVKSPSYTLVEPYSISRLNLYHFDFYRFKDQTEWLSSGFREYFNADSVCLVEWPERAGPLLDLELAELSPALLELNAKVAVDDPYVQGLRVAHNRPGVVRLVLDLKAEVKPQVFTLKPIAEYGHRLVLDLYPVVPFDPLAALIEESEKPKPLDKSKAPRVARLAIIVIDAGHGGEDPGATGRHGSAEKTIPLTIAHRLKALVDAEPNMRALLTRDGDYYLPLHVRVDKARKVKADLFVSIHADAFIRQHARGSSVFALSERRATSEAASWLAKRENEADLG